MFPGGIITTLLLNLKAIELFQKIFISIYLLFFSAEKVASLGKHWHRACLRCAKCNKTLTAGSHAEVWNFYFHDSILYLDYELW